jgi:cytochrome oxidase Cu insertion factor (SCO1/SenC/PrrC family)
MKNLARISNLLADYAEYKVALPELPAETDVAASFVKSVVLVANEQITFAFRVANSFAGSIEINGEAVELSKAFEGFDRTYALADVAFADLDETITVTVLDAEGEVLETLTYSLADYIAGVVAQNEGTVADYAKALWKLSAVIG